MSTKSKIMDRLAKLMRHRESAAELGSTEEAAAFGAEIQRLLAKHKLSAAEVELEDAKPEINKTLYKPADWDNRTMRQRSGWQCDLADGIASAYYCAVLNMRNTNKLYFVGEQTDRECAVYVYAKVVRACERLAQAAYYRARRAGADTKGFLSAFYREFAHAVAIKARKERNKSRRQAEADGRDAALVKFDATQAALDEYLKQFKAGPALGSQADNERGAAAGRKAAEQVDVRADGINADPAPKARQLTE